MACNSILRVSRYLDASDLPLSFWLLHGVTPHRDSQSWIRRLLDLQATQNAVEEMIDRFSKSDDSGVSPAFTEMYGRMIYFSDEEFLPNIKEIEANFQFSLYCDVGLMTRIFATEIGLKCLLSLSGLKAPKRHSLKQLFDLLPPAVEDELERVFGVATEKLDIPDGIVLCSSVRVIVKLYDNLYGDLRYPNPEQEVGAIVSAWHNLGALLRATMLVVFSHDSCRGARFVPRTALQ